MTGNDKTSVIMRGKNHERCWVPGCVNYNPKTKLQTTGFFSFPVNNVMRCRQWLKAVGWEELVHLPPRSLRRRYVCAEHFIDVSHNKRKMTISQTAVPTEFSTKKEPLSDDVVKLWPPTMENNLPNTSATSLVETGPQQLSSVSLASTSRAPPTSLSSLPSILAPVLSEHGQFPVNSPSPSQFQDGFTVEMPCDSGDIDGELWGIIIKKGSTLHAVPLRQTKSVQVQIVQDNT